MSEIGRQLGHYTITRHLGSGGMGEVWEAEDGKLKRKVALKVLPAEVAGDTDRLARFQREAETVAALTHPNVVTVYSVEHADVGGQGVHFLTMELIEGETVAALQPAGGFELGAFFDIAEQLTAALAAAHDKGITHRDLKPMNVMVTDDGHVKVLDFGLAKFHQKTYLDEASRAATLATAEGTVMGTAPYMSPEQAEGKDVDHRSDIFSLGVVLYEMVTGRRPFEGDTQASLASAILRDTPASVDALKPSLPRHVGRIIGQCLEKKPRDRFQTARDVHNQIRTLRRELESEQPSTSSGPRRPAAPAAGPHPLRPAATPVAVAAVAVALITAWLLFGRADPSTEVTDPRPDADVVATIAVLPFDHLGPDEQRHFTAGVSEEISNQLAQVVGVAVNSRTSVRSLHDSGKPLQQIGMELGADYVLAGSVRWDEASNAGRVRISPELSRVSTNEAVWADTYERVLERTFDLQSEIAQTVIDQVGQNLVLPGLAGRGSDHPGAIDAFFRARQSFDLAGELYREEDLEEAIRLYTQAVELDSDFALAYAHLGLANGHAFRLYFDRTEERRDRIQQAAEKALELAPGLPEGHLAMGWYYASGVQYAQALESFQRAADGRPGDSHTVQSIAELQWYMGDTDAAKETFVRARSLAPERSELACALGGVHQMTREWEDAVELHQQALTMERQRTCPYFCLASIYLGAQGPAAMRDFLESIPPDVAREEQPPIGYPWFVLEMIDGEYEAALERLNADPTVDVYDWIQFYYPKSLLRGQVYWVMGEDEQAQAEFESARELLETRAEERPGDPRVYSALAIAYAGLGMHDEAVEFGQRATRMLPIERDHFNGPFRVRDLALAYTIAGRYEEALQAIDMVLSYDTVIPAREFRLDPTWAPLRDRDGFEAIVGG